MRLGPMLLLGALLALPGCNRGPDSPAGDSAGTADTGTSGGTERTLGDPRNEESNREGDAEGAGPESEALTDEQFYAAIGSREDESPADDSPADDTESDRDREAPENQDTETRYLRKAGGEADARVETAVAKFENGDGVRVDLFAEVHIADPAHYAEVQRRLRNYDAVLYELVAEPGDLPGGDSKAGDRSILSAIQGRIGSVMGLGFQLEEFDYRRDNFVHADFTPSEFAQAMEDGGETPWTLILKALGSGSSRSDLEDANFELEPIDFVAAARSGELGLAWRKQLTQILLQINVVEDMLAGTVLLDGRNRKAVDVLIEQMALGKKRMAIHYGGAHMPGIAKILTEELGFRRVGTDWVKAWGLVSEQRTEAADRQESTESGR